MRSCLAPGGAADVVGRTLALVDGRWKLGLLFRLFERPVLRFSELDRDIEGVSQKMLAQALRELERDGLVRRTDHAEMPLRVDYRLTEAGLALRTPLAALLAFGEAHPLPSGEPSHEPTRPRPVA